MSFKYRVYLSKISYKSSGRICILSFRLSNRILSKFEKDAAGGYEDCFLILMKRTSMYNIGCTSFFNKNYEKKLEALSILIIFVGKLRNAREYDKIVQICRGAPRISCSGPGY